MERAELAIEHLMVRLRGLNRRLNIAVARQQQAAARFARPGLAPLCVTDEHVASLLSDIETLIAYRKEPDNAASELNQQELEMQSELRVCAEARGFKLPFDVLTDSLALQAHEQFAVLACVAPEISSAYNRIYGYVLDDLNRQQPSVELISLVAADSARQRLGIRRALGRFGKLRLSGALMPLGEAAIEARQELRLAPTLLDFLFGAAGDPMSMFRDSADVELPAHIELPQEINETRMAQLTKSIVERRISLVGVWGPRHCSKEEVLFAAARATRRPLRRFTPTGSNNAEFVQNVSQAVQTASALDAILWVETDELQGPERETARTALTEALAVSAVPAFLTGTYPWRPARLLETRSYTEFELAPPDFHTRKNMWLQMLPQVVEADVCTLATRFRMSGAEMRAAARLAQTSVELSSNGHRTELNDELENACATVSRKRSDHFATSIKPKRDADDLVLPDEVHRQVVEIAHFFRVSALVDEEWGFGRMTPGGGIKVLFTGEPGTGKTLAAEVIAKIIGLPLLKVDLARVVSKWVGETEKNLDTVFREAEESHSVLFFDEADSLFGKRAEVQHGTDRYANLEIGFLLQRLESYFGLVILASNLKDQIDAAFTRRFHVIVHFPLPRVTERRHIWKLALPANAPTESSLDLDMLMQFDMTGASIVSAARTAALLAANDGSSTISMKHIVRGIARQFRREARILTPNMMGPYADLLKGTL